MSQKPKRVKGGKRPEREPAYPPVFERQVVAAVTGLLRVARIAMPDTYFATDRRVRRGQKLLALFGREPVR